MQKIEKTQELENQLRVGIPIEVAAKESKVDVEEAKAAIEEIRKFAEFDNDSLRLAGLSAMKVGLDVLKDVSQAPEEVANDLDLSNVDFRAQSAAIDSYLSAKTKAAAALLRYSLDVKKHLDGKDGDKKPGDAPMDDKALYGPWKLKSIT